jgi:hypothetical protein
MGQVGLAGEFLVKNWETVSRRASEASPLVRYLMGQANHERGEARDQVTFASVDLNEHQRLEEVYQNQESPPCAVVDLPLKCQM